MRVTAARFVGAAASPHGGPPPRLPEVAIAGRSNVGKSSLINCLTGRRALARTSRMPGRTRQLNFFIVNDALALVDLPGYGFAVGPEAERRAWGPLVETYLRTRRTLRGVVVLVDARRGVEAEEIQLLAFLSHRRRPTLVVATKSDKLSRDAARAAHDRIVAQVGGTVPIVLFSARTGQGRDELWRLIDGWLRLPAEARRSATEKA